MKENSPTPRAPSLLTQVWQQFSSMKFAITLLIIIAVLSVLSLFIGEFYPVKASGPGWQEFWRKELGLSQPVFDFFTFLRLHDPFHSWWYVLLLLLLAISLLACIIERLPLVLRALHPGPFRSGDEISQMPLSKTVSAGGTADQIRRRLPAFFRYSHEEQEGESRWIGAHGLWATLGPILAHSGLLTLTLGGLVVLNLGYSSRVAGVAGEVMTDPGFDFSVRVDSFNIEYHKLGIGQYVLVDDRVLGHIIGRDKGNQYVVETRGHGDEVTTQSIEAARLRNQFDIETDRGNIKSYVSVLTVIENGQEVLQKRVEVNHPLRYRGFRFYQSSFDPDHPAVTAVIDSALVVIKDAHESVLDTLYLAPMKPHPLPDGTELLLTRFTPDFRMGEGGVKSASADLRNPAVLLDVQHDGHEAYHQWAFLRPDFPHMGAQDAAYNFQVLDLSGFKSSISYPTILEVNKSPGAWLIWAGFVLCTIGLILSFYIQPQRIWAAAKEKSNGRWEIRLGGMSSKSPDLFARKFDHWVENLKGREKT